MTPVTPGHPVPPERSGIPFADGSASPGAVRADSCLPCLACSRGKGLAALAALWLLSGCGIDTAFTGGSIPPGGSRLFGRVAAAENPLLPLSHVAVQVETRPVTGGVRILHTTTAADGTFDFVNVPTGSTETTMTVSVTPDKTQLRQAQQIVFRAENGRPDDLVVALPLTSFPVDQAVTLSMKDIATLPPGDIAAIHARLIDAGHNRLAVQPTLLFAGNVGTIAVDETFSATAVGTGTITAFWYRLPSVAIQINVDANAAPLPPSPPDLPPLPDTVPNGPPAPR